MEKIILLLGNITFNHFTDEELEKAKKHIAYTDDSKIAYVHSLSGILVVDSKEKAIAIGEDLCEVSYVVPAVWCGQMNGLLVFENISDAELMYEAFQKLTQ